MQPDRRRFLALVGTGGAGVLLAACGDDDDKKPAASTTSKMADAGGDVAILNYALTLEYLEADFYRQVVDSGEITDKKVASLAAQFGDTEQQHVDALIGAIKKLGGKPVAAPKTDFEAVLAGGPAKILATAAVVENLGAAAYLAEAPKIVSPDILAAALSIHSVEARHAAALNELIGAGFGGKKPLVGSLPDGAFGKPMDREAVLAAAKPFIAA